MASGKLYLLFETSSGFGLFERKESESVGQFTVEVQNAMQDFSRFSKMVDLEAFLPFTSAENALECINSVS